MKKITAWSAWDKKEKKYKHNHIEDGWVGITYTPLFGSSDKPAPKFDTQKGWENQKWKKQYCYVDDNNVVIAAK